MLKAACECARLAVMAVVLSGVFAASASAQKSAFSLRPCTQQDVIGAWQMKWITETPPDYRMQQFAENFPYQYILFAQNQKYLFAQTSLAYTKIAALQELLNAATGFLDYEYKVEANGIIRISDPKQIKDQFACNVAVSVFERYVPGDLILSQSFKNPVPTKVVRVYQRAKLTK